MKISKAQNRDRKIQKRKHGMREDGRSVKYLRDIAIEKSKEIRRKRNQKEEMNG
jgi:hypothetical protein